MPAESIPIARSLVFLEVRSDAKVACIMKRITCKPQFVDKILAGSKTRTCRSTNLNLTEGDIVSFTCRTGKVPAHLIKAKDGFAFGRIYYTASFNKALFELLALYEYSGFGFDSIDESMAFYKKSLTGEMVWLYSWELISKKEAMEDGVLDP